ARPATAQIVPPERNGVDFSVAALSGAPVWSVGFSHVITPALDIAAFYSYQSVGGTTAGLLDVGVRYPFPVIPPGSDLRLAGGPDAAARSSSLRPVGVCDLRRQRRALSGDQPLAPVRSRPGAWVPRTRAGLAPRVLCA